MYNTEIKPIQLNISDKNVDICHFVPRFPTFFDFLISVAQKGLLV